jgi:hypothetical protein
MKKLLLISLLGLSVIMTGCGKDGDAGQAGAPGQVVYIPTPTTPPTEVDELQADIDSIVSYKNEYRALNGQNPLTKNLMCQLFTTTGGDRIQASIAGHNTLTGLTSVGYFEYNGPFDQPNSSINDGMNVLPAPFKNLYKNMYLLRCQGQIVVTDSGYYDFSLGSDDASVLYINGSKLIDNDNNHGHTVMSAAKMLERGVHSFRLDYAQIGGGNQSLILKVNGESIPSNLFYR